MKIVCSKSKIKPNATVIEGFPGFGLVSTIVTEYLIEHLDAKLIGEFVYDEIPPTLAIHQGVIVNPMGIYYSSKKNILIFHTILGVSGFEWLVSNAIVDFVKSIKAKEIICIEGIMSKSESDLGKLYYYSSKDLSKFGAVGLTESIVMGVTAGIMLKFKKSTGLFVSTVNNLPDSNAAAKIIECLDGYLKLKVDFKPLLKEAKVFEDKISSIIKNANVLKKQSNKTLSYVG